MDKFAEACRLSYEDWVSTLPDTENYPEPEFSQRHIKRMNVLFDKMRGDRYHYFTRKAVKVMITAAVLGALLLSAFAFPSSRKFITEDFNIFGTVKMAEHNNNTVNNSIEVGYIPEGYEIISKDNYSKQIRYDYMSKEGKAFFICKNSSTVNIEFDKETGTIEEITSGQVKYTYYTSSYNYYGIIWTQNDYIYQIDGELTKNELLKIAKSLK